MQITCSKHFALVSSFLIGVDQYAPQFPPLTDRQNNETSNMSRGET